jgi:transposase-like protein
LKESEYWTETLLIEEEDSVGRPGGPRRRGYSTEFCRRVVGLLAAGRNVADVARDLGISEQTIYGWRRQEQIDRGLEPGLSTVEKAKLAAATRRVHELEAELAVFAREQPNELWGTDITEHPTREGKVYCAVVRDAPSRRVVGWSIDAAPTAALVTNALGMAIDARRPAGSTVIQSDQGSQYGSWAFTRRAQEAGLFPSMGQWAPWVPATTMP